MVVRKKLTIVYAIRNSGYFTYHESVLRALANEGHHIYVFFSKGWSRGRLDEAARNFFREYHNASWSWMQERGRFSRALLRNIRELRSYIRYLTRPEQDEFYLKRWESRLPQPLQSLVGIDAVRSFLQNSQGFERWLESWEKVFPAYGKIKRELDRLKCDIVVVSPMNMHHTFDELEYLKAAQALGMPAGVIVLSWDNLTTKGIFHVLPDVLFVWNDKQKEEAQDVHRVPEERIVVIGSPFLDKWFSLPADYQKYVKLPFDEKQPYLLYLGSSANIAKDETHLIAEMAQYLKNSDDPQLNRLIIVARPHGGNQEPFLKLKHPNIHVWLQEESRLPNTPESFHQFAAALQNSICAVGLNTTAMVDAILAGAKVLTLQVEPYTNTNASRAVHFKYIIDANVYEVAKSMDEAYTLIRAMVAGSHEAKTSEAEKFILDFIRPYGKEVSTGQAAKQAIKACAAGEKGADIQTKLIQIFRRQKGSAYELIGR